jgi:hypothetical protein
MSLFGLTFGRQQKGAKGDQQPVHGAHNQTISSQILPSQDPFTIEQRRQEPDMIIPAPSMHLSVEQQERRGIQLSPADLARRLFECKGGVEVSRKIDENLPAKNLTASRLRYLNEVREGVNELILSNDHCATGRPVMVEIIKQQIDDRVSRPVEAVHTMLSSDWSHGGGRTIVLDALTEYSQVGERFSRVKALIQAFADEISAPGENYRQNAENAPNVAEALLEVLSGLVTRNPELLKPSESTMLAQLHDLGRPEEQITYLEAMADELPILRDNAAKLAKLCPLRTTDFNVIMLNIGGAIGEVAQMLREPRAWTILRPKAEEWTAFQATMTGETVGKRDPSKQQ